jgi:aminoglycoside 3-N-acetyltransferase
VADSLLTYRDLVRGLEGLGVRPSGVLIAHVSPRFDARVVGGAESVVGALRAASHSLITPTFTLRCMLIPPVGPPDNGMDYSLGQIRNEGAEFFVPDLPVDPDLGSLPEAVRTLPESHRTSHPLLSFAGWNCADVLGSPFPGNPLEPIAWLAQQDADVLLLGVDHTVNVSLHHAEAQAGRKRFTRWALTTDGVIECPQMPGCPRGFQAIGPRLVGISRFAMIGGTEALLIPLRDLLHTAVNWIRQDPRALLCDHEGCLPCAAVRASVRAAIDQR